MIRAVVLAAALGAGAAQAAPTLRFPPRDTCATLTGAAAFRAALKSAIARRDARAFAALAAPDVKLDFGGGSGPAELQRRLGAPQGKAIWQALDRIVPLGCAAQGSALIMPSFFAEDIGNHDAFSVLLVTGRAVRLRPAPAGKPAATLSWNLVEALSPTDHAAHWRKVRVLPAGPTGFVSAAYLRSPVDYRVLAGRTAGKWKISAFVKGD